MEKIEKTGNRMREWIIIIFRGVPVLAEVSIVFAGMAGISFPVFLVLVVVSNIVVSFVYSAAGAWSADMNSFMPATV